MTTTSGFEVPGDKYYVITSELVTNSGVRDVFIAEDRYALLATGSGVDVFDLFCGQVTASGIIFGTETQCVTADTRALGNMYVGTTTSGIYTMPWNQIRAPGRDFSEKLQQTFTTATTPSISDNAVNDIAAQSFRLLASTAAGIDYLVEQESTATVLSSTRPLLSGSNSCFLTVSGEGYWVATNSGVEASYDLNPSSGTGIIVVDFEYNATSSDPLLPSNTVTDIDVIENNLNLLTFSTSAGDFVIEEQQLSEASSFTKSLFTEEPVVSVAFSKDATFNTSGTEYVLTEDALRVFDLTNNTLSGTHFHTISEAEKDVKGNTREQALVSGTNVIVRTTSIA